MLFDKVPLLNAIDYERIYQGLAASIMHSSFGGLMGALFVFA